MVKMLFTDYGETTSDREILKRDILKRVIYKKADQLMTGKDIIVIQNMDALDLKLKMPATTRLTPQRIAEGAKGRMQTIEWFDVNETMNKEQTRVMVTDEAKARQLSGMQTRYSINAAADGIAWSRDTDIYSTLVAGVAGTDAASGLWTDPATDIATDISNTIEEIFDHSTIRESDLASIRVAYPQGLYGHISKPVQVGMIQSTIKSWMTQEFKIAFVPTRQLTTSCLVTVVGEETAIQVVYSGSDIPLVEPYREPGVGDMYMVTQYFLTFIVPEASGGTTNNKIRAISGVKT
jgi:hypothetical protein